MRFGFLDQPHRSLGELALLEKMIFDPRQHIDNGIADGKNVDGRLRHELCWEDGTGWQRH